MSNNMDTESSADAGAPRRRRRLTAQVKHALRELRMQLSLLNLRVGARLDLKDIDLDCLDAQRLLRLTAV